MRQRVITVFTDFPSRGESDLDVITDQLANSGYTIKQIVSTSIDFVSRNSLDHQPSSRPRLAITLLVENVNE
ncbi:hypothetical protein EZS27_040700 [termite gut metagenome]|jgi:hypothetical protein|uniref:Uncharacterized protein n=1 Tax=termite gut metagenome TaxID=433724 RepID=A0A5J4PFE1_9ZZZZ